MVEILLATYNAEKYLPTLLDSVYNQDYENFVLTVSDDGSTDSTIQILNSYKEKFGKMNILKNCENLGAKGNFKRLIENASGDYIMFADHDDKWLSDKISTTLAAMQAAESVLDAPILVHTDLSVTDADLNITAPSFVRSQNFNMGRNKFNDFLAQNTVTGCAMMMNSKLLTLCKRMPKDALMHDWWAALTASAFGKVVFLDVPTILYRQHGDNQVGAVGDDYVADRKRTAKERLRATYRQASLFYNTYCDILPKEVKDTAKAYADCEKSGKLKRIGTVLKYKATKQGFVKFLAQLFYC